MTEKFLLDTSYLIALEFKRDQAHQLAVRSWRELSRSRPSLVVTSHIFDEVVTFFNSRDRHGKAVEIGNRLLYDSTVEFVKVDRSLLDRAWAYFQQHDDKSYSLTDCLSFIVMEREGIDTALTFDRHFLQAGFSKRP